MDAIPPEQPLHVAKSSIPAMVIQPITPVARLLQIEVIKKGIPKITSGTPFCFLKKSVTQP